MKTKEELETLASKIYWQWENGEIAEATQTLNALHSEGMEDAAAVAQKECEKSLSDGTPTKIVNAIIHAIHAKQPKL